MQSPETLTIHETIRLRANAHQRNARLIRFMVGFFFIVSLLLLPVWAMYLLIGGIGPGMFTEAPPAIGYTIAIVVYGVFFVVPFLLCLPAVLPLAMKLSNTARIVVFRKFHNEQSKRAIQKLITGSLAYYGHVFTLSDSKFKIRWYVRIPVFLGQLSLFHFRQRNITRPGHLAAFKKRLSQKLWLNVNWLLSSRKIFAVKTSDEKWKEVATTLLEENNLVIFDVSYRTAALDWETEEARRFGLQGAVIAVASEQNKAEALAWKEQFHGEQDIPLFFYDKKGRLADKEAFETVVVEKLAGSWKTSNDPTSRNYLVRRTLVTSGAIVLVFLLSLFFLSPYLFPKYTGLHSPLPSQAVAAYIHAKLSDEPPNVQALIRQRIMEKWPERGPSLLIDYATDHHRAECDAVKAALTEIVNPKEINRYIQLAEDGEPEIADSALTVIVSVFPANMEDIALRLLVSSRIDTRERALTILKKVNMHKHLATRILGTFSQVPSITRARPFQHREQGGLDLRLDKLFTKDDLTITEGRYYCELYSIIEPYADSFSQDSLRKLTNDNSRPSGVCIIAASLLAKYNDATGIDDLFNATRVSGVKTGGLLNFNPVVYPYKYLADSAIFRLRQAQHVPVEDTLRRQLYRVVQDTSKDNKETIRNLLIFAARNYRPVQFTGFYNGFPAKDTLLLLHALKYIAKNDLPAAKPHTTQIIREVKNYLAPFINSRDIDLKITAATLLAYTGDVRVAKAAVDIYNYVEDESATFQFLRYAGDGEHILEILEQHLQPPYNPQPFIQLKPETNFTMEETMDRIIRKGRQ